MLADEIVEIIKAELQIAAAADLAPEDSLFRGGILDSVHLVKLVVALEERYGISIGPRDIVPKNFDTVQRIATFIEAKRQA